MVAHGSGSRQYPRCLAVSGSRLVSGSEGGFGSGKVLVWSLESLEHQHILRDLVSTDDSIGALLAMDGAAWAGVGRSVVVWGSGFRDGIWGCLLVLSRYREGC